MTAVNKMRRRRLEDDFNGKELVSSEIEIFRDTIYNGKIKCCTAVVVKYPDISQLMLALVDCEVDMICCTDGLTINGEADEKASVVSSMRKLYGSVTITNMPHLKNIETEEMKCRLLISGSCLSLSRIRAHHLESLIIDVSLNKEIMVISDHIQHLDSKTPIYGIFKNPTRIPRVDCMKKIRVTLDAYHNLPKESLNIQQLIIDSRQKELDLTRYEMSDVECLSIDGCTSVRLGELPSLREWTSYALVKYPMPACPRLENMVLHAYKEQIIENLDLYIECLSGDLSYIKATDGIINCDELREILARNQTKRV